MGYILDGSAVYLAEDAYYIIFTTYAQGIAWVKIKDKTYYDHICGMVRSEDTIHKIKVPMSVLDSAGEYSIYFRKIIDRCPYYPKSEAEVESRTYSFSPVESVKTNIYLLGDVHDRHEAGVKTGTYFGDDLNMLVLMGDTSENGTKEGAMDAHRLASEITGGSVPVLYVHGNHEARGKFSTELFRFVGVGDKFYYTFHTGDIYGIVLDAGEDKEDSSEEYGGLACFDTYREEQIDFLDEIIKKGDYKKYKHVLVFLHIQLIEKRNEPMKDIYYRWIERINTIEPELMISAHEHYTDFVPAGSDFFGMIKQNYPVAVTSVHKGEWVDGLYCRLLELAGTAMTLTDNSIKMTVTDTGHTERESYYIDLKKKN